MLASLDIPRLLVSLSLLSALPACGPGKADTDGSTGACQAGEALPAEGSACDEEGAACLAEGEMCEVVEARFCEAGVWKKGSAQMAGCEDPTGGTGSTTDATGGSGGGSTGGMSVPCGTELPPEGSACAMEGEDCAPGADPCDPYVGALCTDGLWMHYEVGPGDPNMCGGCEPFPMEGQACGMEGASCSTGCQDQCQFCNIVNCENGVWHALEVFPAPCLDCAGICEFTVVPMCEAGPPDVAACVAGCMDGMVACKIEFSNVLACAGEMPTFSCNGDQRPTIAGCEAQFDALYVCLGL